MIYELQNKHIYLNFKPSQGSESERYSNYLEMVEIFFLTMYWFEVDDNLNESISGGKKRK